MELKEAYVGSNQGTDHTYSFSDAAIGPTKISLGLWLQWAAYHLNKDSLQLMIVMMVCKALLAIAKCCTTTPTVTQSLSGCWATCLHLWLVASALWSDDNYLPPSLQTSPESQCRSWQGRLLLSALAGSFFSQPSETRGTEIQVENGEVTQ